MKTVGVSVVIRSTDGPDEYMAQWRVVASSFGEPVDDLSDHDLARNHRLLDPRYSIVAVDDGEIIGGTVGITFDLVLPGSARVPANGVVGVGVAPHRTGRGAMRGLMQETLRRAAEAGAAASLLTSSEAPLYGRFGYGCAYSVASFEIDLARASLDEPFVDAGSIDLLADRVAARAVMVDAYDEIITDLPGQLTRSDAFWEFVLSDDDDWMGPAKPLIALHRDADGQADGYAVYTVRSPQSDSWLADNTVVVRELVGVGVEAEMALWSYLTSISLARRLAWDVAPVDPRLRYRLADGRQLKTRAVQDMMWLRPLDVPRLLRERTYLGDGEIGIGIIDELFPENAGPWRLIVRNGEVDVSPGGPADVELTIEQLGMVILGETRVLSLFDANLIGGDAADAAQLDQLLRSNPVSFGVSKF